VVPHRHNCSVYDCLQPEDRCVCADVYALLTALTPAEKLTSIQAAYLASLEEGKVDDAQALSDLDKVEAPSEDVEAGGEVAQGVAEGVQETGFGGVAENFDAVGNDQDAHTFPGVSGSADISKETLALCAAPDLIILSPPWGGPDYLHAEQYCLYTMLTCGCGMYLAMLAAAVCPNLLYLLPVNTSVEQVEYIANAVNMPFVIEYLQINHTPQVMAVYMGAIVSHKRKADQTGANKASKKAAKNESGEEVTAASSKNHKRFSDGL
jgi:hypothetical protein